MKTYIYPRETWTINGFSFPGYLGLGVLKTSSVTELGGSAFADYYIQSDGLLTSEKLYKVEQQKEQTKVTQYFNGEELKVSIENDFNLAFFKTFEFEKNEHGTAIKESDPMFQFAHEIMRLQVYTFLFKVNNLFFPSGFIVRFENPLATSELVVEWECFVEKYNNKNDPSNNLILLSDKSPFSTLSTDGTGIVFVAFLKDAIALMRKEGLLSSEKDTALKVFYF